MADKAITKAPTSRLAYMSSPKRKSGTSRDVTVTWKNQSWVSDRQNAARAEGVEIHWELMLQWHGNKNTSVEHVDQRYYDVTQTSATVNLDWFTARGQKTIWHRDHYYPGKSDATHEWRKGWHLKSVRCTVRYTNRKGKGPATTTVMDTAKPGVPTVTALTQDAATGHVSCKVTCPKGEGRAEAESAWWTRTVYDTRYEPKKRTSVLHGVVARSATGGVEFDVFDRMGLSYDDYVRIVVDAHTRGWWGDSDTRSRTLYVSYPKIPKITSVGIPSKSSTDKVTCWVNLQQATSKAPQHPVTGVRLQVLKSSTYTSESQIPSDAEWEDLDIQDDGDCCAISCTVADVRPAVDTYTWIRLKSWNQIENIFYRYSSPVRLKTLETKSPSAAGDGCTVTKCAAGKDGTSVVVTTEYDEDNKNTGTEITWSEYKDAWTSTDQPDSFDATWATDKSTYTRSGVTRYKGKCVVTVRGLDPNKTYYFRARRYLDLADKDRTYSSYSAIRECTTLADPDDDSSSSTKAKPRPDSVSLVAPSYTPHGEGIPLTWTFQPDSRENVEEKLADKQTGWELFVPAGAYSKTSGGKTTTNPEWIVAAGTDAKGAFTIPDASAGGVRGVKSLVTLVRKYGGPSDSVKLRVRVKTSGAWRESATVTARVADKPVLAVYAGTATSQPAHIQFYSDQQPRLSIVLRALGCRGDMPWGEDFQTDGDAVWSGVKTPSWSAFDATKTDQYEQLQQDIDDARDAYEVQSTRFAMDVGDPAAMESFTGRFGDVAWFDSIEQNDADGSIVISVSKGESIQTVDATMASAYADGEWSEPSAASVTTAIDRSGDESDTITVTFSNAADYTAYKDGTLVLAIDTTGLDKDVAASVEAAEAALEEYMSVGYAYMATVELPEGLDLWDGATYEVTATATNRTSRLTSEAMRAEFQVEWARQAPALTDSDAVVTPHDEWDEAGNHRLYATVEIGDRSDFDDDDRFDVYRVTTDGIYLIYSDAAAGDTVTDPYAPYSKRDELAYRVCLRTGDGDMSWHDYPYVLKYHALRIEFGSRYVELPYNIVPTDSYSKDFEARRYMDGSIDGFWNAGAMHTGGFTTDLIKIMERDRIEDVRSLARYAGACFVRTADGHAYMANVAVNTVSTDYKSLAYGVSLDATEVELAEEYMGIVEGA